MHIVTFLTLVYVALYVTLVSAKVHQVPFNRTVLYRRFVRRLPCDVQVATEHSLIATESTIDYYPAFHGTGSIHEQVCMSYISLHFTRRTSHPFIRKTIFPRSDGNDCALSRKVEEYWPWGRSRPEFVENLRIITAGAIAIREHKCITSSSTITPTPFIPVIDVLSQSIQDESPIPSAAPSSTPSLSPSESPFLDSVVIEASLEPSAMVIPSNSPSPSATLSDLQLEMAFRQENSIFGPVVVNPPLEPSIPVISSEPLEPQKEVTLSTLDATLVASDEPSSDLSLEPVAVIEPSSHPLIETPELELQVLNRGAVTAPYDAEDRIHKEPPPMAYKNAEKNPELTRHLPPGYKRGSKSDIEYFDGEPEEDEYSYDYTDDDYLVEDENDATVAQNMVEGANDFLEETDNTCNSNNHPINHVIEYLVSVGYDFYFDSVSYDKTILDRI